MHIQHLLMAETSRHKFTMSGFIELSRSTFQLSALAFSPQQKTTSEAAKPNRFIDHRPTGPVTSFSTQNPLDRISCRERIHRVEMETR